MNMLEICRSDRMQIPWSFPPSRGFLGCTHALRRIRNGWAAKRIKREGCGIHAMPHHHRHALVTCIRQCLHRLCTRLWEEKYEGVWVMRHNCNMCTCVCVCVCVCTNESTEWTLWFGSSISISRWFEILWHAKATQIAGLGVMVMQEKRENEPTKKKRYRVPIHGA